MSNNTRDLVMGEADVDSEEEDESYDEDTGEARERPRKPREHVDDSSEEEDDDDDEEEIAKVSCSVNVINPKSSKLISGNMLDPRRLYR